jgi:hypothetical protein
MDTNKELIDQIAALDDETLKNTIGSVARNMGFDPKLAAGYLSDMGKIRQAVQNLTDEDLDRVKESLGEEMMGNIIQNIRREIENK